MAETKILQTVHSIARALDDLDADLLAQQFDSTLSLDVSGHLQAIPTQQLTPAQLAKQMFTVLSGFDATQHAISNSVVTVDSGNTTALAVVYFNAYHCIQRNEEKIDSVLARGRWEMQMVESNGSWVVKSISIIRTIPLQANELALYDESVARVKEGKGRTGNGKSDTA